MEIISGKAIPTNRFWNTIRTFLTDVSVRAVAIRVPPVALAEAQGYGRRWQERANHPLSLFSHSFVIRRGKE